MQANTPQKIVLMDGGMGQELQRRSDTPAHPLWSAKVMLEEPHLVQEIHADFIQAGARLLTLNTYSATPERLERQGVRDLFEPLQRKAVEMLNAARDQVGVESVQIAGCLPPLGWSYDPDMTRSRADILAAYREIAAIQADAVDVILCETLSSIDEACAAVTAAVETGLPTLVSLSLKDHGPACLRSGEPLSDALDALTGLGQQATMLNCSKPEIIDAYLPDVHRHFDVVGAYANGFTSITALDIGATVDVLSARKDLDPAAYAKFAMGWVKLGATLVGGCCEVGPAHIADLSAALETAGYEIVGTLS